MKKKMRFAALLASAMMLCSAAAMSAAPVSAAEADPHQYTWSIESGNRFKTMTLLDDKGMFPMDEGAYLCTYPVEHSKLTYYRDPMSNTMKEAEVHVFIDPMFIITPRKDCLRIVLKDTPNKAEAEKKMFEIIGQFYQGISLEQQSLTRGDKVWVQVTEQYCGCYDIVDHSEEFPTEEAKPVGSAQFAESLMKALDDAGLISAFYSWGQTAKSQVITCERDNITLYIPSRTPDDLDADDTKRAALNWDAVGEWVAANHPECRFVCVTAEDTALAKEINFYNYREDRTAHEDYQDGLNCVYAVIPPEDIPFSEHFALAAELYQKFGIKAGYKFPKSSCTVLTGRDSLAAKSEYPDALTAYKARIAGWDDAALDDCMELNGLFLTPKKAYYIDRVRYSPYRIYLKEGTTLDGSELLEKWKDMLRAESYPEKTLEHFTFCTLTASEDGYFVETRAQEGFKNLSLLDCLKTFPQVQRVEAQFGYHTDDRPNGQSNYCFSFTADRELTAEDFPQLENITVSNTYYENLAPTDRWYLRFDPAVYADEVQMYGSAAYGHYFAAVPYLLSLDFVHDLWLGYSSTELADESEDASMLEPEFTVVYDRGDVNADSTTDVGDAVMLARFCAEDTEVTLTESGKANADADGSGKIDLDDVTAILKMIAKLD